MRLRALLTGSCLYDWAAANYQCENVYIFYYITECKRTLEMVDRIWEWKATGGYTIHEESGITKRREDRACTLHFYLAEKGDVLHLLDRKYEYAVATYGLRTDPKYLYTYDYQPEENWAEYRHDLEQDKFIREDYVFTERV